MSTPNSTPASPARPDVARRRLAETFRAGELVWLAQERYDQQSDAWIIDVLRQGTLARWMRQRYRYDEQAEVLYFLGETALSDDEFRAARGAGQIFPSVEAPA